MAPCSSNIEASTIGSSSHLSLGVGYGVIQARLHAFRVGVSVGGTTRPRSHAMMYERLELADPVAGNRVTRGSCEVVRYRFPCSGSVQLDPPFLLYFFLFFFFFFSPLSLFSRLSLSVSLFTQFIMAPKKQLILNAFVEPCSGHQSPGLWSHPDDHSTDFNDVHHWVRLAKLLEAANFHGMFIADVLVSIVPCHTGCRCPPSAGACAKQLPPL